MQHLFEWVHQSQEMSFFSYTHLVVYTCHIYCILNVLWCILERHLQEHHIQHSHSVYFIVEPFPSRPISSTKSRQTWHPGLPLWWNSNYIFSDIIYGLLSGFICTIDVCRFLTKTFVCAYFQMGMDGQRWNFDWTVFGGRCEVKNRRFANIYRKTASWER